MNEVFERRKVDRGMLHVEHDEVEAGERDGRDGRRSRQLDQKSAERPAGRCLAAEFLSEQQ